MRQILAIVILSLTIGCGSSKNPSDAGTDAQTGTNTGTVTTTNTGTNTSTTTSTVTGTSTKTDTTTATSTFTYTDACDYVQKPSVTGGRAITTVGEWTVTGCGESWSLCITQIYDTDIRVVGYAFKTSELGMANPPSLVAYSGVMGEKCVVLNPDTTSSTGPVVEGNGVRGANTTGFTITNGIVTATLTQTGACIYCVYTDPNSGVAQILPRHADGSC